MLVIVCLFVAYSLNGDQHEQQQGNRSSLVRASLDLGSGLNVTTKETKLERADFALQLLMFVTEEKEGVMFMIF